ncbi:hypothetical protein ACWD6K_09090 [Streptomyces sp. NPDC002431]
MRKAVAATALLALTLSACSSANVEADGKITPEPASSAATRSNPLDLRLPAKADYLIPVTTGSGARKLKPFHPGDTVYTVHMRCEGKGELRLDDGTDDPVRVTCGGPVAIGQIFVDKGAEQSLAVSPGDGNGKWRIAVLDGKQQTAP